MGLRKADNHHYHYTHVGDAIARVRCLQSSGCKMIFLLVPVFMQEACRYLTGKPC